MDVTVIPGKRELRNAQLIVTCQFPLPGIQVGQVLGDPTPGFSWRVDHIEPAVNDSTCTVYLTRMSPAMPAYLVNSPPTLDVL